MVLKLTFHRIRKFRIIALWLGVYVAQA